MTDFAHLHVHTEYSLLDGMSRIKDLVKYTKSLNMNAVAITDHGAMYGAMEFYRACKDQGVKPIIGLETYLAPRGMTDRDPQLDRKPYHLLLLAQNKTGYLNLLKIASASQLQGYYYFPRIDKDFLAAHAEGLICTSGCLAAEVPQMIDHGREEEAKKMLGWYWDIFGPDRFYIELQDHDIPELRAVNKRLYDLAPYAQIPFLATNDVHYVRKEDADPHDVLLCVGTSSLLKDPKRMRFSDASYYMRSPQEMWQIFGDVPEALLNTIRVAEMCDLDLDGKEYHLPIFEVPEGYDPASYLRALCEDGLAWRYGEAIGEAVRARMDYELRVIHEMGFDTYFLIVWDLCRHARDADIWWNVRGSGAGSLVAYLLGITLIDPIENSLLFERFLNPGRRSMPDIDIDYPDDRRAEMIEYCVRKYGDDKVAQIITFGTLGARAALRDVGRTMDIPLSEVDALARVIPAIPGKPCSIDDVLDDSTDENGQRKNEFFRQEFKEAYNDKSRPYMRELIETARRLEGISRHASVHAAGVLIADKPLVEYTPLARPTGSGEGLNAVSQWPMEIVESIGLLKVDFLGLRTLSIMRRACDLIQEYHGLVYNLDRIPYRHQEPDEPGAEAYNAQLDKAFRLLGRGETSGVFQVEGEGLTRVLTDMQPSRFEHIVAAISLFRPGPLEYIPQYIRRMHGKEAIHYHHPKLEPILSETFGIIVYQEQIMQVASDLFGYSLGDADLMRRAVSKKKKEDLEKHRAIFLANGPERGIDTAAAEHIFADIEFFARYGFNKSHAADYAVLTVQTAFLKAHYPHEYMTALMTVERENSDKISRAINDSRRMGIPVRGPSVNHSFSDFTIEGQPGSTERAIRFGLSAIKNVGVGAVETLITARGDQPFENLQDFCERANLREIGKKALECMIKVGALDGLAERGRLFASLDRLMQTSSQHHQAAAVGQISLFGEATGVELSTAANAVLVEQAEEWSLRERITAERELLGIRLSTSPLQQVAEEIGLGVIEGSSVFANSLSEADHDRPVTIFGSVSEVRLHTSKKGDPMAFAVLEDLYGDLLPVTIFPKTWQKTMQFWERDRIILVRGKVDAKRGDITLLCDDVTTQFDAYRAMKAEAAQQARPTIQTPPATDDTPPEPPPFEADEPPIYDVEADFGLPALSEAPAAAPFMDDDFSDEEEEAPPVRFRLRFHRSGDVNADRQRLRRLHGALHQSPGRDKYAIEFIEQGRAVVVDFPNESTNYEAVHPQIAAILQDPAAIFIEPTKGNATHG